MPVAATRRKRSIAILVVVSIALIFFLFTTIGSSNSVHQAVPQPVKSKPRLKGEKDLQIQDADLKGHSIMPKLGNETAKAELGRAAWKVLHTTMARFPDEPTTDEQAALKAYVHLFQRLYPCGECSQHFRTIIDKYPPQVSTRSAAAAWACHVHNEVNKSLKKEVFDCSNIGDFYDCGCAEDEAEEKSSKKTGKPAMSKDRVEQLTGHLGREFDEDNLPKLKKEG